MNERMKSDSKRIKQVNVKLCKEENQCDIYMTHHPLRAHSHST